MPKQELLSAMPTTVFASLSARPCLPTTDHRGVMRVRLGLQSSASEKCLVLKSKAEADHAAPMRRRCASGRSAALAVDGAHDHDRATP